MVTKPSINETYTVATSGGNRSLVIKMIAQQMTRTKTMFIYKPYTTWDMLKNIS